MAVPGEQQPAERNDALLLSGLLIIIAALGLWIWPQDSTVTKVQDQTQATKQTEWTKGSTVTTRHRAHKRAKGVTARTKKTVVKTPSTKSTSTTPTGKTTTTTSAVSTIRSETLTLALLGTGAVLMLAGAFSGRLHSVTGPGGIGIQLDEVAAGASNTNEAIKKLQRISSQQNTALKTALKTVGDLKSRVADLERKAGGNG
jgi:hypothetical protein